MKEVTWNCMFIKCHLKAGERGQGWKMLSKKPNLLHILIRALEGSAKRNRCAGVCSADNAMLFMQ